MELNLLLTLDLREQAALQAALVEAVQLRKWLAEARTAGDTDFAALHAIEKAMVDFGL
jgi:hypothetical protein